jgi:hypothetical protein
MVLKCISYYKLGYLCVSVPVSVCVSVCLSGYTFSQFSTDLLQIRREPSTGHDTWRGIYMFCVHTKRTRACVRAKRASMCAFAYIWADCVQICWEHTRTHHKWQGLCTFHCHAPRPWCERASASAYVITYSLIYGRILFTFAVNILQVTSSSIFSSNLLGTYHIWQVTWATHLSSRSEGTRASARD